MPTKISETQISIDKVIPERVETNVYERSFIEQQIIDITKQRNEMIALKEKELKEVQDILVEMNKLGIKVIEEVETPK